MKIGILGIGAWATALANLLSDNGYAVIIWSFEEDVVNELNSSHTNTKYFPMSKVNENVLATADESLLKDVEFLILAIPTQFIRNTFQRLNLSFENKKVINVSKGIEKGTLFRVSQILKDTVDVDDQNYAILSGPSHAEEVAQRIPTAVVCASKNLEFAREVQKIFSNKYFRVYTSDDVLGCELGGAMKNVIAIAAGIIDGIGLGDNTKAALITRGLAEISRLGYVMGANLQTFSGLSGLGDLVVTCISRHSRNRYVGEQLGKGKRLEEIVSNMNAIAEGVETTISIFELAKKYGVELPISNKVHEILFFGTDPKKAIEELMLRQTKPEWWF